MNDTNIFALNQGVGQICNPFVQFPCMCSPMAENVRVIDCTNTYYIAIVQQRTGKPEITK